MPLNSNYFKVTNNLSETELHKLGKNTVLN